MLTSFARFRSRRLLLFAGPPAALAAVGAALSSLGSSRSDQVTRAGPASGAEQRFPLAISPCPIIFEAYESGESAQTSLVVRNTQSVALTLERIETSCSCIGIAPVPIEIGPGEPRTLNVTFDSSSDPDFEGGLSVEISGYLSDGKIAFRTQAKVEVLPWGEAGHD
ncbi:MAG: DUF1573 domain-containing protein [Isosphaerales bacterium]